MSTFAERYDKILKDNNLDIPDAIKITGLSKDTIYNLTSKKTAKKYESFTNLFKICDTPDQVYYLATGKHLPTTPPQTPESTYQSETLAVIRELMIEVTELKEEIKLLREGKSQDISQSKMLPVKIPDP